MNSPPSNHFLYYNHNHDSTLVNVHTLLNPQPFKHHTPPSIPTFQSATAQYWASHPPFPQQQQTPPPILNPNFHGSGRYQNPWLHTQHSPLSSTQQQIRNTSTSFNHPNHKSLCQQPTYNSSHDTAWLLQQILQSQQALNHAISNLASDLSALNTSLPHSINTHNITITQQQSYTPLHQQPTPPLNHTQHITNIAEPTPFNITHTVDSVFHVDEKEKVLISDPVTKIIKEIAPITNLLPEHSPPSLVISLPPPPHISLSTVSKPTFTTEVVADCVHSISETYKKYTATRFTPYSLSLCPKFEQSFCTKTTSSPEKEVVRAVAVTPKQHPYVTVELPALSIQIFDPGGTLTSAVNHRSILRRRLTILHFESFMMFTFCYDASFHIEVLLKIHLFLTAWSLSLLWMPWDRGKKSFNYRNIFFISSGVILFFHGLGINFATGLLTQFGLPKIRFGPNT